MSDEITKDWMVSYYERLVTGESRDMAIKNTQIAFLRDDKYKEYRHPYYWAAFIGSGDWRPLP